MERKAQIIIAFGKKSKNNIPMAILGLALLYSSAFLARWTKKVTAVAVSLCLAFSLLPTVVFADEFIAD